MNIENYNLQQVQKQVLQLASCSEKSEIVGESRGRGVGRSARDVEKMIGKGAREHVPFASPWSHRKLVDSESAFFSRFFLARSLLARILDARATDAAASIFYF